MTGILILLGAYLPYLPQIPGAYMSPKFLCISAGAAYGLWFGLPRAPGALRPAIVAVAASAFLSSVNADSPALSLCGYSNSFSGGFAGVLLMWLCYEAARSTEQESSGLLAVGAGATAGAAVLQKYLGWLLVTELPMGRAYGFAGSPPFLGCMLALAAPFLGKRNLALSLLVGLAVVLSGSRAGIAGYSAAMAVYLLSPKNAAIAAGAGLAAGVALTAHRLGSDSMRVDTWLTAIKAFWARPLLGWGMDGFADAFMLLRDPFTWGAQSAHGMESAHNVVLDIAVSGGVLGLVAWAFLFFQVWKQKFPRPVVAATAGVLTYGLFNPVPFTAFVVLAYVWGEHDRQDS